MKDIYWYEDKIKHGFRIGVRGLGDEIFIPMWDMVRAGDSFRFRNGRNWTDEEAFKWALDYRRKELECVEFEEIPNEILFLTEGFSQNTGVIKNETK